MTARRIIYIVLACIALAAVAAPMAYAAPGWWTRLFGSDEDNSVAAPQNTLIAPFADSQSTGQGQMAELYRGPAPIANEAGLAEPHRREKDIANWLMRAVPEIIDTDPAKYQEHLYHLATGMDQNALNQYQAFMQSSGVLQTMTNNHLKLHVYVEEMPIAINQGAVDARYRWLFEMPVNLTFLNNAAASYDNPQNVPVNQHVIVRVQVGRMPVGQGIDEMEIESFEVRKNPDEQ